MSSKPNKGNPQKPTGTPQAPKPSVTPSNPGAKPASPKPPMTPKK